MAVPDSIIEGVSGAIGAVVAVTATYPLLTLSTQRALELRRDEQGVLQLQGRLRLLPGPVQDMLKFANAKGWRALFTGLKPAVVATTASSGIYFTCYSMLRQAAVAQQAMRQGRRTLPTDSKAEGISVGASIVIAAVAGWINVLLTNPIWVIHTQMQALQKQDPAAASHATALSVARRIYQDGPINFWQGLWPSMVMVINPTLQYVFYEWLVARALELRRKARPHGKVQHLGALDVFVLSAWAKMGATIITYPLQVVKNRLQAINSNTHSDMQYTGVLDAVRRMVEAEGYGSFFKGLKTKMLQTVLAAALLMMLKEQISDATRLMLQPVSLAKGAGLKVAVTARAPRGA